MTWEVLIHWADTLAVLYLKPIFERLHVELLMRSVIMEDETPCGVYREDGSWKSFSPLYPEGGQQ